MPGYSHCYLTQGCRGVRPAELRCLLLCYRSVCGDELQPPTVVQGCHITYQVWQELLRHSQHCTALDAPHSM